MINVNFVDYMRQEVSKHEILRPYGSGDYLFLYFPVPMKFCKDKEYIITEKHACILFAPKDAHSFCGNPDFINTFIHFNVSENEVEKFHITTNQLFYPSGFQKMNETALDIKNEILMGGELYKEIINAKMLELLVLIKRGFSSIKTDIIKEQFEKFRYEMLSDCSKNISISKMSSELGMSRTAFYKYYKEYFNSSPKQDILKMRMEKAMVLLTNQRKTVSSVAEEVGFANTEHFIRYYKKYFGKSPRKETTNKTSI